MSVSLPSSNIAFPFFAWNTRQIGKANAGRKTVFWGRQNAGNPEIFQTKEFSFVLWSNSVTSPYGETHMRSDKPRNISRL